MRSKPTSEPPSPGGLPELYVSRLERLVRLRRDYDEHLNELGVQLLDRSIVATVRDCVDAGVGERAWALVADLPEAEDGYWQ